MPDPNERTKELPAVGSEVWCPWGGRYCIGQVVEVNAVTESCQVEFARYVMAPWHVEKRWFAAGDLSLVKDPIC